jgi:hypothetical protein
MVRTTHSLAHRPTRRGNSTALCSDISFSFNAIFSNFADGFTCLSGSETYVDDVCGVRCTVRPRCSRLLAPVQTNLTIATLGLVLASYMSLFVMSKVCGSGAVPWSVSALHLRRALAAAAANDDKPRHERSGGIGAMCFVVYSPPRQHLLAGAAAFAILSLPTVAQDAVPGKCLTPLGVRHQACCCGPLATRRLFALLRRDRPLPGALALHCFAGATVP